MTHQPSRAWTNRPSCGTSSGSAPTVATCRCRRTAGSRGRSSTIGSGPPRLLGQPGRRLVARPRHRLRDLHRFAQRRLPGVRVQTTDYGETWASIAGNLPAVGVNVIREISHRTCSSSASTSGMRDDRRRQDLAGDEERVADQPVHDLKIHPRERDLIVATHGRGIFIADISALEEGLASMLAKDFHLFDVEPKVRWTVRRPAMSAFTNFDGESEPNGVMIYCQGPPPRRVGGHPAGHARHRRDERRTPRASIAAVEHARGASDDPGQPAPPAAAAAPEAQGPPRRCAGRARVRELRRRGPGPRRVRDGRVGRRRRLHEKIRSWRTSGSTDVTRAAGLGARRPVIEMGIESEPGIEV